jgi:hypothetical protein
MKLDEPPDPLRAAVSLMELVASKELVVAKATKERFAVSSEGAAAAAARFAMPVNAVPFVTMKWSPTATPVGQSESTKAPIASVVSRIAKGEVCAVSKAYTPRLLELIVAISLIFVIN